MTTPARFAAIARRCAVVSCRGRRGRSLLPMLAPLLELQGWQDGTRFHSSAGPPSAAGTG